jgi:formylglycine-generating enzyme required for sulfatase activity
MKRIIYIIILAGVLVACAAVVGSKLAGYVVGRGVVKIGSGGIGLEQQGGQRFYGLDPNNVITNSIGMKFAYIPPGEFMMGSAPDEKGRACDEGPQHPVKIYRGFYMGITQVTRAQYRAVAGKNPGLRFLKPDKAELPVEQVNWSNAVAFCKKLSEVEGRTYRLPTEAEWEYACRAGTMTRFSFGDSDADFPLYGNIISVVTDPVRQIGFKDGYKMMAPVATFRPNGFGLYDMHGNIYEWCSDWYGEDYYSKSPIVDPNGPATGSGRVVRGGSWNCPPHQCRSAHRRSFPPYYAIHFIGFRVLLEGL